MQTIKDRIEELSTLMYNYHFPELTEEECDERILSLCRDFALNYKPKDLPQHIDWEVGFEKGYNFALKEWEDNINKGTNN